LPEHWGAAKAFLHALAGRQPAPDLVFAPSPADAHQDHALVGSLAPTVWRDSLILGYEIPKWDGDLGRPSAYVSVAPEVARRKVELLTANFTSQIGRDWWDDEVFFGLMRLRGMECRSQYAEAFHISKLLVAASGQDSSAQDYGAVK
jgi:LmbE family N-acetylglucosaminyl deacetylase